METTTEIRERLDPYIRVAELASELEDELRQAIGDKLPRYAADPMVGRVNFDPIRGA